MNLWWLRPTREGRFFARHRDCCIESQQGSNSFGYYTMYECREPVGTRSWGHLQYRWGISHHELGLPYWA